MASTNGGSTKSNVAPSGASLSIGSKTGTNHKAYVYMILLAIQFGIQPIISRRYTSPTINKSTVLLVQEIVKFIMAYMMLLLSGNTSNVMKGWNVNEWLSVALIPAGLYAIQNMASLTAYQNLDPFTYNTLNQTKTLSAALCCYFVMGRKQSPIQVLALLLLLFSALIMEGVVSIDTLFLGMNSNGSTNVINNQIEWDGRHFTHGVVPILLASFISGLAGSLSQMKLQQTGGGRDAYLFTMELCAATCIILLISLLISSDGEKIRANGVWDGWTMYTLLPIMTNSAGGLIVGLVTKYAGSVRKGFALIFGIFLSGIIQAIMQSDKEISKEQILGGTIAAVSLYLHAANPPTINVKNVKQD